jgi:hypothetical protein
MYLALNKVKSDGDGFTVVDLVHLSAVSDLGLKTKNIETQKHDARKKFVSSIF